MTNSNFNKLLSKASLSNLDMQHLIAFENDLEIEREKCKAYVSLELRTLYSYLLDVKVMTIKCFNEAKEKYELSLAEIETNHKFFVDKKISRENQNKALQNEIKSLFKKLRTISSKEEKDEIMRKINQRSNIIKFNKSSIELLPKFSIGELGAHYQMFLELAEDVNEAYNLKLYDNKKKAKDYYLELFKITAGTLIGPLGLTISILDCLRIIENLFNNYDRKGNFNNTTDSIDSGFIKIREEIMQFVSIIFLIKLHLQDIDFFEKYFEMKELDIDVFIKNFA